MTNLHRSNGCRNLITMKNHESLENLGLSPVLPALSVSGIFIWLRVCYRDQAECESRISRRKRPSSFALFTAWIGLTGPFNQPNLPTLSLIFQIPPSVPAAEGSEPFSTLPRIKIHFPNSGCTCLHTQGVCKGQERGTG